MNAKTVASDVNLLPLIDSFRSGSLAGLRLSLQKEVWDPHNKEEGSCKWDLAWEDVISIFAEEFSKEGHQP